MQDDKKIVAWTINITWGNGKNENVDLPNDFRQAQRDINCFLDYLEDERIELC